MQEVLRLKHYGIRTEVCATDGFPRRFGATADGKCGMEWAGEFAAKWRRARTANGHQSGYRSQQKDHRECDIARGASNVKNQRFRPVGPEKQNS